MSRGRKNTANKTGGSAQEDDKELTFERGFGAQDKVVKDGETLADLGGVSEADIRKDLLKEKLEDEKHA